MNGPTEGPWVLDGDMIVAGPVLIARLIPNGYRFGGFDGAENPTANGYMLAAAPELVDACQLAVTRLLQLDPGTAVAAILRNALAKARGER